MILDPGMSLTLRPMRYPQFYEMYRAALRNTWVVEEVDFTSDIHDLQTKLTASERHMIHRLVAFFATGDTIVANNLVLNLYKHINAPEARMYLSRQLFEEANHIAAYLTVLDNYISDVGERERAFAAVENIASIEAKARFCFKWTDSTYDLDILRSEDDQRRFLLNLIGYASCVEGLFFFAAFAYVYFMRSKGLLNGFASVTNWIFRDESCHMNFAFEVVDVVRRENPNLFDDHMQKQVVAMIEDAVAVETQFANDLLGQGISGLSTRDMRGYLEFTADQRLNNLGLKKRFNTRNPLGFMELQDVQELTNFFERRVSAYQTAVSGEVRFDEAF